MFFYKFLSPNNYSTKQSNKKSHSTKYKDPDGVANNPAVNYLQ